MVAEYIRKSLIRLGKVHVCSLHLVEETARAPGIQHGGEHRKLAFQES